MQDPIRCKVVNQDDREYRPIPTPLREGSFMLELCPIGEGYIFASRHLASTAISHTMTFATANKLPLDKKDYVIFNVGEK